MGGNPFPQTRYAHRRGTRVETAPPGPAIRVTLLAVRHNFRYDFVMAHISYIEEHEAPPELKALYDRYREPAGHVDNIIKIHGPNPPSLEAHYQLYATLMRGRSDLTREQREMIAVVVSAINECHY